MLIRGKRARWPWQRMSIWLLTIVILLLSLTLCVGCAPTRRPLDERPTEELAWQAWLLVDTHSNDSDRRITPKSVFIAPKLGNGGGRTSNLPDCAEGYRPDSMGRCVKFVKVDEKAHFNFLLHRLNSMYATTPRVQQLQTYPEPFQLNIPLAEEDETEQDPTETQTPDFEVIVVSPSDPNKSKQIFESQSQDKWKSQVEKPLVQSPSTIEEVTIQNVPTTTIEEDTIIAVTELTTESTTLEHQTEFTITNRETTTESDVESTTNSPQALFFLISPNNTRINTPPPAVNKQERLSSEQLLEILQQFKSVTPRINSDYAGISHRSRDRSEEFWRPLRQESQEEIKLNQPVELRYGRYTNPRSNIRYYSPPQLYQDHPRSDLYSVRQSRNHHAWSFS